MTTCHHRPPKKHGKRFTPSDVATLQEIQSLSNDGFTYDEIPDQLTAAEIHEVIDFEEFEEIPEQQPQQPQDNAIAPIEFFEHITHMLETQATQHQREIAAKDETIALLREELERARLPWWKRLFS